MHRVWGTESGHPGGREEGQGEQGFLSQRPRACEGWRTGQRPMVSSTGKRHQGAVSAELLWRPQGRVKLGERIRPGEGSQTGAQEARRGRAEGGWLCWEAV